MKSTPPPLGTIVGMNRPPRESRGSVPYYGRGTPVQELSTPSEPAIGMFLEPQDGPVEGWGFLYFRDPYGSFSLACLLT